MSSRSNQPGEAPSGRLHVEVPHWAASVTVYDKQLRPVADLDTVRESTATKGVYEAAAEVPPGIYKVEVTLASSSQQQLVAVYPRETARIPGDSWKLEFNSAAPLAGTSSSRESHMAEAEAWSRRTTWTQAPGGDSRLFLFVRTKDPDPDRHPYFSDGLYLLDGDGRTVTDLDRAGRRDAGQGWLAFNAELPAGYYILRRGRRGVRVRYQALYLCAGWETQVFLLAGTRPSLRTLTMTMAPLGAGFRADDDTAVAAEVLLDGLRRTTGDPPITSSEKLTALLHSGRDNPWLSVLAAYSLLRSRARLTRQRRWEAGGELAALLDQVLASLEVVDDHPDARAARLRDDQPTPAPFWHPPLLRVGLARVQHHATRHADTIPLDSLTDGVLDNQVTNSPWTAWRQLDRLPRSPNGPPATAPMLDVRAAAPNAPMYPLGDEPAEDEPAAAAPAPSDPTAPGVRGMPLVRCVIQEALAEAGDSTALPEKLALDPARTLDRLLEPVQPEAVSEACGLPLARTEAGLERCRRGAAAAATAPGRPRPALDPSERAVMEYAFKHKAARDAPPGSRAASLSDAPAAGAPAATGEDIVSGLRIEADRLLLRADDRSWRSEGGDPEGARGLGSRLLAVTDELLRRTDFLVLADADGRLVWYNRPFEDLVSPPVDEPAGRPQRRRRQRQERGDHRRRWEAALAGAPLGHSRLPAPAPNRVATEWELSRTVIEDEGGDGAGRPRAYFNVLRHPHAERLPTGILEQVRELLSELKQYSSLFAYGSAEHRGGYAERLQELTAEVEAAVAGGAPASPPGRP